ncbi:hypothetical protein [Candidatus Palauibacter sp.]|uniref:hypothetical protein n=1 Tax=Candidatus Palauibacter sp. TaxID=3101350 RepID=UPI003C6EBB78
MKDVDSDLLPDLYTQRQLDKTRRRQRTLGRIEGGVAVAAGWAIFSFLPWIPAILVLSVVGYLIYRFVVKPRKSSDDPT